MFKRVLSNESVIYFDIYLRLILFPKLLHIFFIRQQIFRTLFQEVPNFVLKHLNCISTHCMRRRPIYLSFYQLRFLRICIFHQKSIK